MRSRRTGKFWSAGERVFCPDEDVAAVGTERLRLGSKAPDDPPAAGQKIAAKPRGVGSASLQSGEDHWRRSPSVGGIAGLCRHDPAG